MTAADARASTTRRAEHEAAALDAHIQALVDAAPPLTADTRDRLAVLLRPEGATGAGAA